MNANEKLLKAVKFGEKCLHSFGVCVEDVMFVMLLKTEHAAHENTQFPVQHQLVQSKDKLVFTLDSCVSAESPRPQGAAHLFTRHTYFWGFQAAMLDVLLFVCPNKHDNCKVALRSSLVV